METDVKNKSRYCTVNLFSMDCLTACLEDMTFFLTK
jgi:hypothetical protein